MSDALKDTLYVKNSVSMLDDFELNECSIEAQLIFHRGMLLAKRAATDGVVSWRQIAGQFIGKLDDGQLDQAIDELLEAGLWGVGSKTNTFVYTGWLKHNEPVEQIESNRSNRKQRQREAAHRTNHDLGRHADRPTAGCPLCPDVSPGQNGQDGNRPANRHGNRPLASPRLANASEKEKETEKELEKETEKKTSNTTTANSETQDGRDPNQRGGGDEDPADAAAIADDLMLRAGYGDQSAGPDLIGYTDRALHRGWPITDLQDLATEIGSMDPTQIDTTAVKVLLGGVRKRANNDPIGHHRQQTKSNLADQLAEVERREAEQAAADQALIDETLARFNAEQASNDTEVVT